LALALPADGRVVCCDRSAEWTQIAKDFWQQAGVTDKIQLILGEAKATLANLLTQGEQQTFDFVFIDADKTGYDHYYEVALELLRPGGLIAVDNVLWYGNVADPAIKDKDTQALRLFNQKLHQDSRISLAMIPIGDGLTLARKH
jgi:caffeoyl-CoA O-methyltransferase